MTVNSKRSNSGLRKECLSFPEILAQSLGNIAPSGMVAVTIPLVFASAGKGTWLAFLIATLGLVLVSLNINQFARHSAAPGALYSYVAKGLGLTAGVLSGWALILAYLFTAMTVLGGFAIYMDVVLASFGIHAAPIFLFAICAGLAWYYAYSDVQLSTVTMLILEVSSIGLILLLAVVVLFKQGFTIDTSQLSLEGVSSEGLRLGLVLAIFSYVGFESATAMGDEAKNPLRSIPRAVIWSTVISGLCYVILSYTEVIGFSGYETSLDKVATPLSILAKISGVGGLGAIISIGVTISFFTCCLASISAGARIFFAMARHGLFHSFVGQAHIENETPHIAVTLCSVFVFLVPASISMFGIPVLDIYGYLGSIAAYGFLLVYILVSIAAPMYLHKQGKLTFGNIAIAALAILFMLVPVIGSVYPVPAFPYNVFPYLFLLYLVVGGGWFLMLRLRSPQTIEEIERDMELIHGRFEKPEVG